MTMIKNLLYCLALSLLAPLQIVLADSNGMDMSMDGAMALASGNMLSYLHFTPGDVVWFQGWVPRSARATVGACVGLFLLALFDRWLSACRGLMETHWRKQAQIILSNKMNANQPRPTLDMRESSFSATSYSKDKEAKSVVTSGAPSLKNSRTSKQPRISMPFVPVFDIPRGIIHAAQSALEFAFMLIVMTYQVAFILSIVIGLGVGETLFGRYNAHAHLY